MAILVPLAAIATIWLARRARSWRPMVVVGSGYLAAVASSSVLKVVIGRVRPDLGLDRIAMPTSAAFPSTHAAQSMVVAVVLAWLARSILSRHASGLVVVVAAAFTTAVGLSRIGLGAHWPIDVVVG